jgi:hypothetical protein
VLVERSSHGASHFGLIPLGETLELLRRRRSRKFAQRLGSRHQHGNFPLEVNDLR